MYYRNIQFERRAVNNLLDYSCRDEENEWEPTSTHTRVSNTEKNQSIEVEKTKSEPPQIIKVLTKSKEIYLPSSHTLLQNQQPFLLNQQTIASTQTSVPNQTLNKQSNLLNLTQSNQSLSKLLFKLLDPQQPMQQLRPNHHYFNPRNVLNLKKNKMRSESTYQDFPQLQHSSVKINRSISYKKPPTNDLPNALIINPLGQYNNTGHFSVWAPNKKNMIKINEVNQNPMRLLIQDLAPLKCTEGRLKVMIAKHLAYRANQKSQVPKFNHGEERIGICLSAKLKPCIDDSCILNSSQRKEPKVLLGMKAKRGEEERNQESQKEPQEQENIQKKIRNKPSQFQIEKMRVGLILQQKDLVKEYLACKDSDGICIEQKRNRVELEQKLEVLDKILLRISKVTKK